MGERAMFDSVTQFSQFQSVQNGAARQPAPQPRLTKMAENGHSAHMDGVANKQQSSVHMSVNMELINKAIDEKVAEFFNRFPDGGSDDDVAEFLENVSFEIN